MPPNVIDLVSSSPSPPTSTEACHSAHHVPQAPPPIDSDLLPLSDSDFDDLDLDGSSRKRRKTNPLTLGPSLPSRPPLVIGRNAPLHPRAYDPIDVSSSMERASPKCRPPVASEQSRMTASTTAPSLVAAAHFDSDPFASSPEPPRLQQSTRVGPPARRAVSLDPFVGASSPMGSISLSPKRPAARKQASPAAQRVPDLDHGRRHGAASPPPRLATGGKHFDVISIDSGSSDDTNDSDFPDVCDIDIPRRSFKPRSPIRRSRSDNISSAARSKPAPARLGGTRNADDKKKRAAEKAAEKERKRLEREQAKGARAKGARAKEKERAAAMAEANKLRTDKKVSTPEMIVNIPSSLGAEHREQVQTLLTAVGADHAVWESPVQGIVKWRRKVTSRFDMDLARWEPIPPRIHEESHALAIFTADEFVESVLNAEFEIHARAIREHFAGYQIIYLLQGMEPWIRKNRNLRNRQFTSGVRAENVPNPIQGRRRQRDTAEYIPEDQVEDALLRLQVGHDVFIHNTTTPIETAKWVVTFTQHISTIPYRKQKDHATSTASFCMESGQVRTGDGPKDTYVRMLQEIVRVTAPIAYGVANEFDSLSRLVRGLEANGPERLESVRKSANKDGQLSDRVIGQAVSRRLYKVFTGRDELSTDV